MGMNDGTTGETSVCVKCRQRIEHGIILRGYQGGPGKPIWRTPDRGHGCAKCPTDNDLHKPGHIRGGIPT